MKTDYLYLDKKCIFGKSILFCLLGLFFLVITFYSLIKQVLLPISLCLCVIGVTLELIWFQSLSKSYRKLLKFVEESSSFVHPLKSPMTISELIHTLYLEGFEIKEFPYGNYYCLQKGEKKFLYHFFIANNDTPNCPETEAFCTLFIQKFVQSTSAYGREYFVDFEYGTDMQEKAPEYVAVCKKGFITTKNTPIFGFRIAYDTKADILYYAEAVGHVITKGDPIQHINTLFQKLFPLDF